MRKIIFTSVLAIASLVAMAQKPSYMATMGETLSQMGHAQSIADLQQVANKFQVISKAEPQEWLPDYYQAECYILMSFSEQDATKRDAFLDVAEKLINNLLEKEPKEAEVFALQAFYYTGRLVVNPMERGQKYSAMSGQATAKALALDPKNPRARLLQLQMEIGSAPFTGQDPKSFCPQAKELLAEWDDYKAESPIYPSWGKEQVANIVKSCE